MMTINSRILVAIILVIVMLCPITHGKVIYVDDDAIGTNDGTNWTNAYIYLQDALTDANDSEKPVEIRVAKGTYTPDCGNGYIRGDKQATFLLKSGIVLKGGFAGIGNDDPDAWNHQAYETVLSGDLSINNDGITNSFTGNSEHVICCTDRDATAVLDGFTITDGYAQGGVGGGIYNDNASPTILRCVFLDNRASTGGGMYVNFSSPTIINCTFVSNAGMGGGIYIHESHPVFESCIFHNNRSTSLGGGGMHCVESNPTLTNCLFTDNYAPFGAAIYTWKANPTIINCTFSNNEARSWGGGIQHEVEGYAIIRNCIFWGNTPNQIRTTGGMNRSTADVKYSNIQGGYDGEDNIDMDPLFANPDAGDYHLQSQAGRWDAMSNNWVFDDVTSPCIDAGDPNSSVVFEPVPNGGIINMGYYGGTSEASKSPFDLSVKYSGGTGEPNDPYQISTAADLILLGESPEDYYKHFILIASIDLDPNLPGRKVFDRAVIAPDNETTPWEFDGTPFAGVFDGNGHTISHLTITSDDLSGLFGHVGPTAKILNLGLEVVDVNGGGYIGGLVGENEGSIVGSYSIGTVSGGGFVGGLVGRNWYGSISTSYSSGIVTGGGDVGGLVGENWEGSISGSFSTAAVTGKNLLTCVGGLVGLNRSKGGRITNSYSTGAISGGRLSAGLVGENTGSITASYSSGKVTGDRDVGGLIGKNSEGNVTTSFWDTENSGLQISDGGIGLTTAEMHIVTTFLEAGWDFVGETENGTEDIWWINEGQDYPKLARRLSAFSPEPQDGAMNIIPSVVLRWLPGESTRYHDIYMGEDEQAVANATKESLDIYRGRQPTGMTMYDPGILGLAKTYYWRIDEVNEADPNSPWKGKVWTFSTSDSILVDDFENYSDLGPDRNTISDTWIGSGGVSRVFVHGGTQSMQVYGEATADAANLKTGRNWIEHGAWTLSLWFRGHPDNTSEPMYVALTSGGQKAIVIHADLNAVLTDTWTEWPIALWDFAAMGLNLTRIDSISIGLGFPFGQQGGGSGVIYIDDIRLYPPMP